MNGRPAEIVPHGARDPSAMLGELDDIRKRVESGELLAFACVGLDRDTAIHWIAGTNGATRHRLLGAIAMLMVTYSIES